MAIPALQNDSTCIVDILTRKHAWRINCFVVDPCPAVKRDACELIKRSLKPLQRPVGYPSLSSCSLLWNTLRLTPDGLPSHLLMPRVESTRELLCSSKVNIKRIISDIFRELYSVCKLCKKLLDIGYTCIYNTLISWFLTQV